MNKLKRSLFNQFDKDGSGELEIPEFRDAWNFLGLHGSDEEIKRAFTSVDVDGSGKVDRREFATAIRDSRVEELGMR